MTITAKFQSRCPNCGRTIEVGDKVNWERGQKAQHISCQGPTHEEAIQAVMVEARSRVAVEDAGVYIMPDSGIVKVQATRDKKRTYAMRWNEITGERALEVGGRVHGEWVYEQGLISQVATVARKMTLEEAKAFILRFGQCVRCGRHLKAAESVERGIGPVCITYFTSNPFFTDVASKGLASSEQINAQWAEMKNAFSVREQRQEEEAYARKYGDRI